MPLQPNAATGLSSDLSRPECIDHFAVSRPREGLKVVSVKALDSPFNPYGAGSPAEVVRASDHVPLMATVQITDYQDEL